MTNDNFKPFSNLPKTETKIVLNDWSQPVKKSPLSAAARSKVINRSGGNYVSESQEYGPCSYSGCSYKNVDFNVSISIEGQSRNWARYTSSDSLPGYWTYSSHMLGDYYWRNNLWLNQIDQARHATYLMDNNSLYVVNAAGLFCAENGKFCDNAKRYY